MTDHGLAALARVDSNELLGDDVTLPMVLKLFAVTITSLTERVNALETQVAALTKAIPGRKI